MLANHAPRAQPPLQNYLACASAVLGGSGGFLQAEVKVSPGEMLEVLVGGGGGGARGEAGGAGGFNGGQPGGWNNSDGDPFSMQEGYAPA